MTKMTHDHTGVSKKIYRPKDLIQTGRRKKVQLGILQRNEIAGKQKTKVASIFLINSI